MNFCEYSYSLDLIIFSIYLENINGGLGMRKKVDE